MLSWGGGVTRTSLPWKEEGKITMKSRQTSVRQSSTETSAADWNGFRRYQTADSADTSDPSITDTDRDKDTYGTCVKCVDVFVFDWVRLKGNLKATVSRCALVRRWTMTWKFGNFVLSYIEITCCLSGRWRFEKACHRTFMQRMREWRNAHQWGGADHRVFTDSDCSSSWPMWAAFQVWRSSKYPSGQVDNKSLLIRTDEEDRLSFPMSQAADEGWFTAPV